jgi:S-adenosylmethionine decarboxylase
MTGREWIVDAYGCSPDALKDRDRLVKMFDHLVESLALHPVQPQSWHQFPEPGGLTGFLILAESHLACHTFPEHGSLCLSLFCCRPRSEFNYVHYLAREFGAADVRIRRIERQLGAG